MQFEIDIAEELSSSLESAKKFFRAEMQQALTSKITNFFRGETIYTPAICHIRGAGEERIEEFIIEKFCSDENYNRIMEECMTRAIQHNFNRLAFARMRKEKIQEIFSKPLPY